MPYSSPTDNSEFGATYTVGFYWGSNSEVSFGASWQQHFESGITEQEADEIFQKLVDLIESSPDFTFNGASKSYPAGQVVTPTP